ncbi:hypothetical protein D3C87_1285850 [compost metagenome]
MTELFCKLPHVIMAATYWISALTGERISFTGDQKILWVWMCKRFHFFHGKGGEWFDNQADIAVATGTSESTVKRFMTLLVKHGYMAVKKRRCNGFIQSNSYTILGALVLGSPASGCASGPVPEVAPVPTVAPPDEPEERTPAYAPNIYIMPTRPEVKLSPSPVVAPEVARPKVNLPRDVVTGNDPVWEVRRSS